MPHRLDELNKPLGFFEKLGYTLALLLVGVLTTPLFCMGVEFTKDPVLRWMLQALLEALVPFYLLLIVFIWWRPKWLIRWYAHAETKLVRVGRILCGVVFILLLIVGACALIVSIHAPK